jgi:hypothetical protein
MASEKLSMNVVWTDDDQQGLSTQQVAEAKVSYFRIRRYALDSMLYLFDEWVTVRRINYCGYVA